MATPSIYLIVNGLLALLFWLIVLAIVKPQWTQGQSKDQRVIHTFWFALLFALCVTFQVRPVYLLTDGLLGIPNVSWLLSYLCLTTALRIGVSVSYRCLKVSTPRVFNVLYGLVVALLIGVFSQGIASSPQWVEHTIPRSGADMAFMLITYLYAAGMGVIPAITFARLAFIEASWPVRTRAAMISMATWLALLLVVIRVSAFLHAFFLPEAPRLSSMMPLIWMLLATSGLGLLIAVLPASSFIFIARCLDWWSTIRALRELHPLRKHLEQFCPPIVPHSSKWWERWLKPDYYLYQTVIYIFDSRKLLAAGCPTVDAEQLLSALQSLPEGQQKFEVIVQHCRQISRTLGTHERNTAK